ncbi:hypothetical protein CETAM_01930 [Corynebacterium comes]|uniref:Tellurium resistance protein TerC n=2 Tax=Corynebacterium comes TaxID=2675218 RepID=A0A6B8W212_9CORY|nr:hypothetical protein CETAM_01930 [Corynebacterium comes]
MFPGMYASPDDPNRGPRKQSPGKDGDTWPNSLRWGYYVSVAAAIFMVFTGLVVLTQDVAGDSGASADMIQAFGRNVRFIGAFNIIAGLVIAALAAQLKVGGRISRRVLAAVFALAVFFNTAAFAIQVGGFAMVLIVVLLGVAAVMLFRPDANEYIRRMSSRED